MGIFFCLLRNLKEGKVGNIVYKKYYDEDFRYITKWMLQLPNLILDTNQILYVI